MLFNLCLVTLTAGFAIGHFKIRYGGWMPYLVIEGLVGLLIFITLAQLTRDRSIFSRVPVTRVFMVLCLYSLTAIIRPDIPIFSGLMGYRALLACPALFITAYLAFEHPRQLHVVYFMLMLLGVITAGIGLYQWNVGPDVVATWGGRYAEFAKRMLWTRVSNDEYVFRAFSTFVQPGVFGATMAAVMLTVLAQLMSSGVGIVRRAVLGTAFAIMGAGLLVSASRLSMIMLTLGTIVMVSLKGGLGEKSMRFIRAAVVLTVTLWLGIQFTGPILVERLRTVGTPTAFFYRWFNPTVEGLRRGIEMPIGLGLGYTSGLPYFVAEEWLPIVDQTHRNIDSGLGSVAQELGVLGVILYVAFTILVARASVRSWRALPPGQIKDFMLASVALAVLAVPLIPIANLMVSSYPFAIIYWLLVGMVMKAPFLLRRPMPEAGPALLAVRPVLRPKVPRRSFPQRHPRPA